MRKIIGLLAFMALFVGCDKSMKYSYSISDFNKKHRKHLERIVTLAVFDHDTSYWYINNKFSDNELKKLSKCEHPILRLTALNVIMDRNKDDHNVLINEYLNDTAIVIVDEGEFGQNPRKIPDAILRHTNWKSEADLIKTREKVILKHYNLSEAYYALRWIEEKDERFYESVKKMTASKRLFYETELALYKLAQYQKPEDVLWIKNILLANNWKMDEYSFKIMDEYPNPAYMEVLYKFLNNQFPIRVAYLIHGNYNNMNSELLNTLLSYKNDSSVMAIKKVVSLFEDIKLREYKEEMAGTLYYAIQKHPSPLYNDYIKKCFDVGKVDTTYYSSVIGGRDGKGWTPKEIQKSAPYRWY
jgi:hypothetical protein